MRLVVQALLDYRTTAHEIFEKESDFEADIGEDITREALDRLGVSRIDERLFGKIDYKRARFVIDPEFVVRQALLVDSKAEKVEGSRTATLQTAQTSLQIRLMRKGTPMTEEGKLPKILRTSKGAYLTTTVFVKYNYRTLEARNELISTTIAALPNGMLQDRYNPTALDTIWLVGRDAPTLGEAFRVRLSFEKLKRRTRWRVQEIPPPAALFTWMG
ncbi:MAG: SfiI family type II restriction endonuclease [Planctomycetes bacterium]|nr:SfiI family type II restriction endonuclease [Planctomycetota bacterium]